MTSLGFPALLWHSLGTFPLTFHILAPFMTLSVGLTEPYFVLFESFPWSFLFQRCLFQMIFKRHWKPVSFRKCGRPALLLEDLMKKTIETIQALRLKGALVTAAVISAIAKGIVMANDRTILVEHGRYLSLTYDWGRNVLYCMERKGKEMTMRMATTEKISAALGLLKEAKLLFQRKIKTYKPYTVCQKIWFSISIKPHCPVSVLQVTPSIKRGKRVCCLWERGKKGRLLELSW